MAVNLSPVGGVAAQFFNNDGTVLSGGKLNTYTAGTTTPATTYTTSAGTIAHSNPIQLNSAGRVPGSGEIWLTDGITYKFVLTDANDVLIATYDNISGINSNFINFTNQQEIQTATAGQTIFTLTTMQYQPGTGSLSVFVDGVNQYGPGAQYAFTETSGTVVTFITGLHVGASVKFTTSAINAASYGDAFQISYTPPFNDSVATNVGDKLSEYISVKDFGAVGDGVTDDTDAFVNAFAELQSLGGGKLTGDNGDTYLLTPAIGGELLVLTNVDNIDLDFGNCVIQDSQTYTGSDSAVLFNFINCNNVKLSATIETELSVTLASTNLRGLVGVQINQGGSNFLFNINQTGGLQCIVPVKLSTDPASYSASLICGTLNVSNCYYPYNAQYSGNNVNLNINANTCGRNFIIYGVNNNVLNVNSVNQQVTSILSAAEGFGLSDIHINYVDTESTSCQSAAPVISLTWTDTTPATHCEIYVHMNTVCPAAAPWGHTFTFDKYNGSGGADNTGRGHVLEGFYLSGKFDRTGVPPTNNHVLWRTGQFASPDVQRNVCIRDFWGNTNAGVFPKLTTLAGISVWSTLNIDGNINTENGTNGLVIFNGCRAANFTDTGSNIDQHQYISCISVDSTTQAPIAPQTTLSTNKKLVNDDRFYATTSKNVQDVTSTQIMMITKSLRMAGYAVITKRLAGDQTGVNSIARVPLFYNGLVRISYSVIADTTDTNPATRDETHGIVTASISVNGSGTVTTMLASANEGTPRSLGTASTVTVGFANGSASLGGYITVTATNYSSANAFGVYIIELQYFNKDSDGADPLNAEWNDALGFRYLPI